MKKLVLLVLGGLLLLSSFAAIAIPSAASAAGGYTDSGDATWNFTWVNAFQIVATVPKDGAGDGGYSVTFMDNSQDNSSSGGGISLGSATFNAVSGNTPNGGGGGGICDPSDTITGFNSSGTQAVFHCNGAGEIATARVAVAKSSLDSAYFNFKDQNTINTGNGRREFDFAGDASSSANSVQTITNAYGSGGPSPGGEPNFKYIYSENNSDLAVNGGDTTCKSGIGIDPSATNSDGTIQDTNPNAILVVATDSAADINLDSYPASITSQLRNINSPGWQKGGIGNCIYSKPIPIYVTSTSTGPSATNVPAVGAAGGSASGSGGPSCGDTSDFAWIICPAITWIGNETVALYNTVIQPMLQVQPIDKNNILQGVWGAFRNLADVFFVVVFLIVIFSTAISTGLDSYTVKKMMPRLVMAAILIQFSYFLCGFMVDVGNVLGLGILALVQTTLSHASVAIPSGNSANAVGSALVVGIIAGGGVVAAASTIAPTLLFILIGFIISILVFIITLGVRLLLIDVFIILSPVAIILWVLPNTEKLFKKWLDNFIKAILMFPLISLLMSAGLIVSSVAQAGGGGSFATIIGLFGPIVAFFLMPMTFKMAGGAMAGATSAIAKVGNAGNNKVQNSKMATSAKDNSKALRESRNLEKAVNGTGFGKRRAQISGGFGFGMTADSRAQRDKKLNAARDKVEADSRSAASRQLRDLPAADLEAIATAGDNAKVGDVTVTEAHRTAAIDKLASTKKTPELERAKAKMGDAAYNKAINQSGSKDEIFKLAPHLAGGNYDKMSSEKLSKLNGTGAQALLDHLAAQQAKLNPGSTASATEQAAARDNINGFTGALAGLSPAHKGSTDSDAVRLLYGGTASDGSAAYDPAVGTYVQSRIDNASGRYK